MRASISFPCARLTRVAWPLSAGLRAARGLAVISVIHSGKEFMTSGHDMQVARETYNGFIKAFAWGAAICFATALVVIALIA